MHAALHTGHDWSYPGLHSGWPQKGGCCPVWPGILSQWDRCHWSILAYWSCLLRHLLQGNADAKIFDRHILYFYIACRRKNNWREAAQLQQSAQCADCFNTHWEGFFKIGCLEPMRHVVMVGMMLVCNALDDVDLPYIDDIDYFVDLIGLCWIPQMPIARDASRTFHNCRFGQEWCR